ncbi:MAG: hypothetical protein Q7L19_03865 [Pseudohongiella sp.]|nr:hypothetical protein [Pseudohongiella sp.]
MTWQHINPADTDATVDNSRMGQFCTLYAADVTRLLQGLVAKGVLIQEGQARWSRYRLPVHVRSEHTAIHYEHDAGYSEHKGGRSEHSVDLLEIAKPARSQQRLQLAETEKLILRLCQNRWLSRNESAQLLDDTPTDCANVF